MKQKTIRVLAIMMVLMAVFSISAYAAEFKTGEDIRSVTPTLKMTFSGNTATCKAVIRAPGKSISATLELWQGSTFISSWSGSNTSSLTLSGNATVTSGLPYTLTVSGTIDGVAFTPASITKTP